MRIAFDQVHFGWLLIDRSFEPLPLPDQWQFDSRGRQIEDSRQAKGYPPPVYVRGAHYPTRAEQLEVSRAYMAHLGYKPHELPPVYRTRQATFGGVLWQCLLFWCGRGWAWGRKPAR